MKSVERRFYVGLDLGQARDPTAFAVVERTLETDWSCRDGVGFRHPQRRLESLVHLERPALQTPYPDIVERTRVMVLTEPLRGVCSLVVDATGVGRPVLDMLREALRGTEVPIVPVMITGGDKQSSKDGFSHVPKRDLVAALAIRIQRRALAIAPGLPHWDQLLAELMNFRMRMSPGGHDSYEAWRSGQHDDLVLALALACWAAGRPGPAQLGSAMRLPGAYL